MSATEYNDIDRFLLSEIFTTDEAYRNLAYLCDDIGHRYPGSQNEKLAANYLKSKMESYGLANVHLEEFFVPGWERGKCEVVMTAPVTKEISAIALPYCNTADLEAEIIDVGEGETADYERLGDAIRGKIVVTDAETEHPGAVRKSHRSEKFSRAIKYGAVAIVFINQNPGLLHITGSGSPRKPGGTTAADRESPFPGIGITWEGGSHLRRMAQRGPVTLRITTENRTFESTSQNVIGDIVGTTYPNEVILLGGHYDCHDIAVGAGDDGTGTITGLEAGRALAQLQGKFKRTIRIICFGSEEITLRGSAYHAKTHITPDNPETYRFVLNTDGAGQGQGSSEELTVTALPEVAKWFKQQSRDMHYDFFLEDHFIAHSDHLAFALRGVPNAILNSKETGIAGVGAGLIGRGYGHTEADTLDKVCLRGMQMSAILAARLVARLANDDEFPGRRRSVDEVRDQLIAIDALDFQVNLGRFPPA